MLGLLAPTGRPVEAQPGEIIEDRPPLLLVAERVRSISSRRRQKTTSIAPKLLAILRAPKGRAEVQLTRRAGRETLTVDRKSLELRCG